jgi:opacity protein-like surface antigen
MKKHLILLAAVFCALAVNAQTPKTFSLNAYGGYTFKDKVNFDASYAYVDEAFEYGGGLEYFYQRNQSIEVKYLRMDTHIPYYLANGVQVNKDTSKGAVQYVLADFNGYFGSSSTAKAVPYAGAGLGVGIISIKDGNTATKFAWDAKLGVKLKTASSVSINLQAYIQSIISAVGNDYWVYPGGAVVAVADYATLFQFGLGAAICFNLKKH